MLGLCHPKSRGPDPPRNMHSSSFAFATSRGVFPWVDSSPRLIPSNRTKKREIQRFMPRRAKLPQIPRTSSAWSDHLLAVNTYVAGYRLGNFSVRVQRKQKAVCDIYLYNHVYVYYIYYVWWCSLSSFTIHISPQTSQTKYQNISKLFKILVSHASWGNSQWFFLFPSGLVQSLGLGSFAR